MGAWTTGQEFVKHTVALWGSREKLNVSNPIRKETDSQISTESLESVNRADQQGEEKHWYWPSAPPAQSTIQFNNSYLYLRGGKHPNTFPADIRPSLIGVKILPEVSLIRETQNWTEALKSFSIQSNKTTEKPPLFVTNRSKQTRVSTSVSMCLQHEPGCPKGWHRMAWTQKNNLNFP